MNWKHLTTEVDIDGLIAASAQKPQAIFKHSTRCSISSVALQRMEKASAPEGIDFWFLDLLQYRKISNAVAERFGVEHESPQVLLIKNGACVFDESHLGISMAELAEQAAIV